MNFINNTSAECAKSELDIFHTPETQAMVLSGRWVDNHPISSLSGNTPIDFDIPNKNGDEYTDLSQTYLNLKVKFTKADGSNLSNTQVLAPINFLFYAIFSQIDIWLNNVLVTSSNNTQTYRSVIELLTNYGQDALNSIYQSILFHKDTAGYMNSIQHDATKTDVNKGFIKRREIMGNSREIDMMGRLHCDIFFQNRYLINLVPIKIKLSRNKSSFCYIGDADSYKMEITNATLYTRSVKINPDVLVAHAMGLEKATAKYPINRVEVNTFTLAAGGRSYNKDGLTAGTVPSRIVFAMVENDAFNGAHDKNPFNFQHFDLEKISFSVDGVDMPHKPIEMDFNNKNFTQAYYSLFLGLNKNISDTGSVIEKSDFEKGYSLFAFDLTPDLCNGSHFNVVRTGNLRANLNFSKSLAGTIVCICYMEFQNILEINKNRGVFFDYKI